MGRPVLHFVFILSQTSAGKRDNVIALSLISVSFLCSRREAVPSSRPAGCAGHRAQGPSRLAVAVASVLAPAFAGHALYEAFQVKRYFTAPAPGGFPPPLRSSSTRQLPRLLELVP